MTLHASGLLEIEEMLETKKGWACGTPTAGVPGRVGTGPSPKKGPLEEDVIPNGLAASRFREVADLSGCTNSSGATLDHMFAASVPHRNRVASSCDVIRFRPY